MLDGTAARYGCRPSQLLNWDADDPASLVLDLECAAAGEALQGRRIEAACSKGMVFPAVILNY